MGKTSELGMLREWQADKRKELDAILARTNGELAKLKPDTHTAEFIVKRRAEVREKTEPQVRELMAEMEAHQVRIRELEERVQPAPRRLAAAMADPAAAAAIRARLASTSFEELARLAREAAMADNWLLADAIVGVLEERTRNVDAREAQRIGQLVMTPLAPMGAIEVAQAKRLAMQAGQDMAHAKVVSAPFVIGRELLATEKIELAWQYPGPETTNTPYPEKVAA